jgi:hypothetical protein
MPIGIGGGRVGEYTGASHDPVPAHSCQSPISGPPPDTHLFWCPGTVLIPVIADAGHDPVSQLRVFLLMYLVAVALYSEDKVVLYSDTYTAPAGNGPAMTITLREIERNERTSEVRVVKTAGGPTAATMFVVKGMYSIAKARKMKFFINLKEWTGKDGEWNYIIGFSNDDTVDVKTYFKDQFDPGKELTFMSVEQSAMLFENK